MRIAVPFDKAAGTIAEQFDRTEAFRLYNLENGQIVSSLSLPAFGTGNEAMAEFLKTARADVVICGGITARGRQLLGSEGIAVYPGFGGSADDAAQAFAGELALPVDMTMAETASVVFLHAPLTVSVKETAHVTATFSESLVFRSCAAEEKNATDNQLHLNRPAQTAYMERRNGPTYDFTQFPEDYRNSRYRRG